MAINNTNACRILSPLPRPELHPEVPQTHAANKLSLRRPFGDQVAYGKVNKNVFLLSSPRLPGIMADA